MCPLRRPLLGVALLIAARLPAGDGHGQITWPPSTRHGGSLEEAGHCWPSMACFWFSQPTSIPGPPTLPQRHRTFNVDVSGGPKDWTARMPWRAPGSAPVLGSGCGTAGGGPWRAPDGVPPQGLPQGFDGKLLPKQTPHEWQMGSEQEVAFAIAANVRPSSPRPRLVPELFR